MLAARALIKERDFEGARHLLMTVDHPKAREWLAKLPPAQRTANPFKRSITWKRRWRNIWTLVIVFLLLTMCFWMVRLTASIAEIAQEGAESLQSTLDNPGTFDLDTYFGDEANLNIDEMIRSLENGEIDSALSALQNFVQGANLLGTLLVGLLLCAGPYLLIFALIMRGRNNRAIREEKRLLKMMKAMQAQNSYSS